MSLIPARPMPVELQAKDTFSRKEFHLSDPTAFRGRQTPLTLRGL